MNGDTKGQKVSEIISPVRSAPSFHPFHRIANPIHSFTHSFIDSPSAHTNHLPRFHNIYSLCFAACIISLLKFTAPFSSITCLFAFAFVCTPASKPPFLFFFVTFNSRRGNFPHLHIWSKELGLRHCQYPPCVSRTCCTNSSA